MRKAGRRTLPKRERNSSENSLQILSVDRNAHTVHVKINGMNVTAVCREHSNPDVYESVKGILIRSAIE